MTPLWIASDWHLRPGSPVGHVRLALAFLAGARTRRAEVILNGDVFDDLFAGPGRAQAAHPEVAAAIATLEREGRLRRTSGNHDPDAGDARIFVAHPGIGRVLVAHGHALDPLHASPVGRLGDAVARRFGTTGLVRGAARLAEALALGVAGERMVELFRARCEAAVEAGGFALGVFGHVHRAHAREGDRYANAGSLRDGGLEYLVLEGAGLRIERLRS